MDFFTSLKLFVNRPNVYNNEMIIAMMTMKKKAYLKMDAEKANSNKFATPGLFFFILSM